MTRRHPTTGLLQVDQGPPQGDQEVLPRHHPQVMQDEEAEAEAAVPLPLEVAGPRSSNSRSGPLVARDGRPPSADQRPRKGPDSAPARPTNSHPAELPPPPLWRSGTRIRLPQSLTRV